MTMNIAAVIAGRANSREKSEKVNPYKLPGDAQLFSYYHYKKQAAKPIDTWIISHKNAESAEFEAEVAAAGEPDANAALIKELRKGSGTFSKSRYVNDVRQLSRCRLVLGRKRDASIQLEQQLDIEKNKFHEIKHRYEKCALALERFLAHEHVKSMSMLEQAEAEYKRTTELSERRDELSRRYGQTRLEVYHWEETWRTVRACHRFVLRVSPLAEFDEEEEEEEARNDGEEDYAELMDSPIKDLAAGNDFGNDSSLLSLIAAFEQEANALPKSSSARTPKELGLVEPGDLLRIFRAMELQNLNALIHLETLGGPMADMMARIDVAEGDVRREIDDVLEDIKRIEKSIIHEEHRARNLERRSGRLVQQGFRSLICSEEALRARVLVEDAYESCVGHNEAGLEPLDMARALENAYESLSARLDLLPQHLVVACEREGFLRELKESREAEDAARKFELMHRLLAALKRMMEPLEPKRRPLVRRSQPRRRRRTRKSKKKSAKPLPEDAQSSRETHFDFFEKVCRANLNGDEEKEEEESDEQEYYDSVEEFV